MPCTIALRFVDDVERQKTPLRSLSLLIGDYAARTDEQTQEPAPWRHVWLTCCDGTATVMQDERSYNGFLTVGGINQWAGLRVADGSGHRSQSMWFWKDKTEEGYVIDLLANWNENWGLFKKYLVMWRDATQPRAAFIEQRYGAGVAGPTWRDELYSTSDGGVKFDSSALTTDSTEHLFRWLKHRFEETWFPARFAHQLRAQSASTATLAYDRC